jgi:ribonucleoside-diphosphate reductase alpha chain
VAFGEPGVVFIDTVQRDDSLAYRETIAAVNPCGEQPLPHYGGCCLGSIDLTRFVRHGLTAAARFDHQGLARVARVAVRMLDNVIDLTPWPLPAQAAEARRTRRIGLGVTGLADALVLLGLRYSRAEGRTAAAAMLRTLRNAACQASVSLAKEKGPFPAFDASRYLAPPGYASRLPHHLQNAIARHGVRNSHRLSLAPAGSISLAMAGGVSSGVEPVWGWHTSRTLRQADGTQHHALAEDPVWRLWRRRHGTQAPLPPAFETIDDITPTAQLAMVAALAPLVDGAIAKTLHLPAQAKANAAGRLLIQAWESGVKGITVWRRGLPAAISPGDQRAPIRLRQPLGCRPRPSPVRSW